MGKQELLTKRILAVLPRRFLYFAVFLLLVLTSCNALDSSGSVSRSEDTQNGAVGFINDSHSEEAIANAYLPEGVYGRLGYGSGYDSVFLRTKNQLVVHGALGLFVFDLGTANLVDFISYPGFPFLNSMKVTSDEKHLVTQSSNSIDIWLSDSFERVLTIPGFTRTPSSIRDFSLSNDGKLLAVSITEVGESVVSIWSLDTYEKLRENHTQDKTLQSLAFSPDGKLLVTGDTAGELHVMETQNFALVESHIVYPELVVRDISYSPDARFLAIVLRGQEEFVIVYDASDWTILNAHKVTGTDIFGISFTQDNAHLAMLDTFGELSFWDFLNREADGMLSQGFIGGANSLWANSYISDLLDGIPVLNLYSSENFSELGSFNTGVVDVMFLPEPNQLLAAYADGEIVIWNTETKERLHEFNTSLTQLTAISVNGSGDILFVAGLVDLDRTSTPVLRDSRLQMWSLEDFREIVTFDDLPDGGADELLRYDEHSQSFILGSYNEVHVFYPEQPEKNFWFSTGGSRNLAFLPDLGLLASASGNGAVRVKSIYETGSWPADYSPLVIFESSVDTPRSIALSPDGTLLAVGDWYGRISVWSLESGLRLYELNLHSESVDALYFTSDGELLISASFNGYFKVWSLATGHVLNEFKFSVFGGVISFSSNETFIAVGGPGMIDLISFETLLGEIR